VVSRLRDARGRAARSGQLHRQLDAESRLGRGAPLDGRDCRLRRNTLNQQAIWKAQGIDVILRQAWDAGIVLGGASAGGLCWFEEGTTDSRPKELSIVHCLGFLKGSHCPHYDAEKDRRPLYLKLVGDGTLKPGYAMDNDAGVYFEDNTVKRVVTTKATSKVYRVDRVDGNAVETALDGELIS